MYNCTAVTGNTPPSILGVEKERERERIIVVRKDKNAIRWLQLEAITLKRTSCLKHFKTALPVPVTLWTIWWINQVPGVFPLK